MELLVTHLPEILIGLTVLGLVVAEATYFGEPTRLVAPIALAGAAGAAALVFQSGGRQAVPGFSDFLRLLAIGVAAAAVMIAKESREVGARRQAEASVGFLGMALCVFLAAVSDDLLLWCVSGVFFVLIGATLSAFNKDSGISAEAGFKFLAFGLIVQVLFAFGLALLFSHTGSFHVSVIQKALQAKPLELELYGAALVLFACAGLFWVGAFPFHFWLPDIFEGSPTPVALAIAGMARLLGLNLLVRCVLPIFVETLHDKGGFRAQVPDWDIALSISAGVSMVIGALGSLKQQSLKRYVGYIWLLTGGMVVAGFLQMEREALVRVAQGLPSQLVSLVGVMAAASILVDGYQSDRWGRLGKASSDYLGVTVGLAVFIFSILALPPSPLFISSLGILGMAYEKGWLLLVLCGVGAWAVALAGGFRFVYMVFGESRRWASAARQAAVPTGGARAVFLALLILPWLAAFVGAEALLSWLRDGLPPIFW